MIVIYIFLYFLIGALVAFIYCIINGIPSPLDMSEEGKNMFVLIDTFWPLILPFVFIRRLYKAIKFFVNKNRQ